MWRTLAKTIHRNEDEVAFPAVPRGRKAANVTSKAHWKTLCFGNCDQSYLDNPFDGSNRRRLTVATKREARDADDRVIGFAREETAMQYARFGKSGLEVSRICFGCMSFGKVMEERPWVLGLDDARPLFRRAWEAGINFFDTANVYAAGTSEEITGTILKELAPREEIVLATKVFFPMRPGPNGRGLSRKAILGEIDNSLKRLGTEYVDLYQIHRFDPFPPVEETREALHAVVKAGKARYIGASSMFAWQFAKALHVAERNGWTRFVTMQNHLNLLYREEEREMLPLCRDEGIGVIPWSPLARGRLTRDWDSVSRRQELDAFGKTLYHGTEDSDRRSSKRWQPLPRPVACRAPRWRSPGSCRRRRSRPPSLVRRSRAKSTMRWRHSMFT